MARSRAGVGSGHNAFEFIAPQAPALKSISAAALLS
jgi:hypothetical protein